MLFLSQQGEDIYILTHFINKPNPNIQISFNGIHTSNKTSNIGSHPFTELNLINTINQLCKNT